jgi:pyrroline-5-carboxylate reductase
VIVGFAGAGNMAAAMARGWAAGEGGPDAMLFCDIEPSKAEALAAEVGGEARPTLPELAARSDVLLLAVKPSALDDVAAALDGTAPALLSVIAATPLTRLGESFPGVPALRAMPNQPVEVRRGVICHPPPAGMEAQLAGRLLDLLGELGQVVELDEGLIDTAMAVMSCAPAYVALFAEALAGAGAREGLDRGVAKELVLDTFAGTAELLRDREPAAVREAVASPGGSTEAGLEALAAHRVAEGIEAAVDASLERMRS